MIVVLVVSWFDQHVDFPGDPFLTNGFLSTATQRWMVFDREGWWIASLRTTTRVDGLLLGALAALVFVHVDRYRRAARATSLLSLGVVAAIVLLTPHFADTDYLRGQGIVFTIATATLVLSIAVAVDPDGFTERFLGAPLLRHVGRISFPLYLWHLPLFWAASRWARSADWRPRLIVTLLALGVIAHLMQRFVERPLQRFLDRHRDFSDAEPRMPASAQAV